MKSRLSPFVAAVLAVCLALLSNVALVWAQDGSPAPISIIDDAGRAVVLEALPERIVSTAPSTTDLAFAAGLGDKVVAIDSYSNYPPEAAGLPTIGTYMEPDLESIVGSDPDLVLATNVHLASLVPALEGQDVPVVVLDAPGIEAVLANLTTLGALTDDPAAAEAVIADLQARVEAVEAQVAGLEPVRVFYELDPTLFTAGPGTFIDDIITRAGGANIAAGSETQYPQLSPEDVITADPEVILLADQRVPGVDPESVAARPGWDTISAVTSGRIVPFDPDIASRPGPRVVDALEVIADLLHPAAEELQEAA